MGLHITSYVEGTNKRDSGGLFIALSLQTETCLLDIDMHATLEMILQCSRNAASPNSKCNFAQIDSHPVPTDSFVVLDSLVVTLVTIRFKENTCLFYSNLITNISMKM